MDERKLFGLDQEDSASYGKWAIQIKPNLELKLRDSDDKVTSQSSILYTYSIIYTQYIYM